jgi:hypothetical protein
MNTVNHQTNQQEQNRKRKGLLTSLLVHVLFLLIMLGFTLEAPYPPPLEQGIAIQFGGETDGNGKTDHNRLNREETDQNQDEAVQSDQTEPTQKSAERNVATQDQEDAPSMRDKQTVSKKPDEPNPIDRKALFPESRSGKNKGQSGAEGQKGSSDGKPQGGVQGDPRNNGLVGFQDYSLQGRNLLSFERPKDESQLRGVVVLNVSVNWQGQVVQAELNTKKSTISRPDIVEKCKLSARKFRFSVADNQTAPPIQTGSIVFRFELN